VRVLAVVHQRDAGPGVFGEAAAADGHELLVWMPPESEPPLLHGFDAAIVFGGGMHVDQEAEHPWLAREKAFLRDLLAQELPVLGVCLGAQLLAEAAGAMPGRARQPEIGWKEIELTPEANDDPLLGGLPRRVEVFAWHSYEAPLPPGATALARSDVCLQAYRLDGERAWGVQFHPEVSRADLWHWLDDYEVDPDAVRIGLDPAALRTESEPRIEDWNDLGRTLVRRFLASVTPG
jgi:GMP synthase (glutamine-hydrolysing)